MLALQDLSVSFGARRILDGVSIEVGPGEILGLVGESGAGKSILQLAIMGLLPPGFEASGSIALGGQNILGLTEDGLCDVRGNAIAMVFQEPMTALNPLMSIEDQVAEVCRVHERLDRQTALQKARKTLARVELGPKVLAPGRYPHQLSGGQRQRAVIAMAIAAKPKVLLADEPTTALDMTTQAQIIALLAALAREDGCALIYVTHDLPLVASLAGHIAILKDGQVVEQGPTKALLKNLQHPYSQRLFAAAHHMVEPVPAQSKDAVLRVDDVTCAYGDVIAVEGASFDLPAGGCTALIGPSGCGKSTLARAILGLEPLQRGHVDVAGARFAAPARGPSKHQRRDIQIVFQDPFSSFNPRHKVGRILAEPFYMLEQKATRSALASALARVGLEPDALERYPHAFSGGQRQRIAIARALIPKPKVVVLDEAVSALDVSVRADVLDLLAELRRAEGVAYLFITHDLSIIEGFADDVMVMQRGRIVERGTAQQILHSPQTRDTQQLLSAMPQFDI
jgi:peptide/nickel transport system ATP-binding protein